MTTEITAVKQSPDRTNFDSGSVDRLMQVLWYVLNYEVPAYQKTRAISVTRNQLEQISPEFADKLDALRSRT